MHAYHKQPSMNVRLEYPPKEEIRSTRRAVISGFSIFIHIGLQKKNIEFFYIKKITLKAMIAKVESRPPLVSKALAWTRINIVVVTPGC